MVLERNAGLLGLPRAIAYDAETLRLFTQVGLFEEIAPGLIQDPHVRHLNARNVTLMAADFRTQPLRPFFARHLLSARLRESPARRASLDSRRSKSPSSTRSTGLEQNAKAA